MDLKIFVVAIIGGIIGAIIKSFVEEPLKKYSRGEYKVERQQKKRLQQKKLITDHFRKACKPHQVLTTENIHTLLFPHEDLESIYHLLKELEDEGILHSIDFDQVTMGTTPWRCILR